MKIIRYLHEEQVRYGIVDEKGVHPCSGTPFTRLIRKSTVLDPADVKLLAPVDPPNIICIGLNYRAHAAETGHPLPAEPLVFLKATTSLCSPGDPIILPAQYPDNIDYEAELAVVIGKMARNIPEDKVDEFILGYTAANDVSNRAVQFADGQWARGKSHDTFCPVGPAIVTFPSRRQPRHRLPPGWEGDAGLQHLRHDIPGAADRFIPFPILYPSARHFDPDRYPERGRLHEKAAHLSSARAGC